MLSAVLAALPAICLLVVASAFVAVALRSPAEGVAGAGTALLGPDVLGRGALLVALLGWAAWGPTASQAGVDWSGPQVGPALSLSLHLDGVGWACGVLALILAALWPRAEAGVTSDLRLWAARLAWVASLLLLGLLPNLIGVYLAWVACGLLALSAAGAERPAGDRVPLGRADLMGGLGLLGAVAVMANLGSTTDSRAMVVDAVSGAAVIGILVAAAARAGWWPISAWRLEPRTPAQWRAVVWVQTAGTLSAALLLMRALGWAGGGWQQSWVPLLLTALGLLSLLRSAFALALAQEAGAAVASAVGLGGALVLVGLALPTPSGPLLSMVALTSMVLAAATLVQMDRGRMPAPARWREVLARALVVVGWAGALGLPGSLLAGALWLAGDLSLGLPWTPVALAVGAAATLLAWAAGWPWLWSAAALEGTGPEWSARLAPALSLLAGAWPAAALALIWAPAVGGALSGGGGAGVRTVGLAGLSGLQGRGGDWPALLLCLSVLVPLALWLGGRRVAAGETAPPPLAVPARAGALAAAWVASPPWWVVESRLRVAAGAFQEIEVRAAGGWFTVVVLAAMAALVVALR